MGTIASSLLLLAASPTPPTVPNALAAIEAYQRALFERTAGAVVFVSNKEGFGSGVIVSPDGLILTNAHVVGNVEEVMVVLRDGQKLHGVVQERARDNVDLALVKVAAKGLPALPIASSAHLRIGDWVAAVGHGSGGVWTFNVGMVSNIYPGTEGRPIFQTQIPLNPGSSGGPVLDSKGRLVGIVTAGRAESNNINFAIRVEVALSSLTGLGGATRTRPSPKAATTLTIVAPKGAKVFLDGALVGMGGRVSVEVTPGEHEVAAAVKGRMLRRKVRFPQVTTVELE